MASTLGGLKDHLKLARDYALEGLYDTIIFFDGVIAQINKLARAPSIWRADCYIVPSKTPLDKSFNDSVSQGKRYCLKKAVIKQRKKGREIGLVIDLTNTTQYYSPIKWITTGTKHVKIPCKPRDTMPDNEAVNKCVYEVLGLFFSTTWMEQFLCLKVIMFQEHQESKNPKYILDHCTKDYNRTGFMLVHYLMHTQTSSVVEALKIFAKSRPPGINKVDYIEELYSFYHEVPENTIYSCKTAQDKFITTEDILGDGIPNEQ